jgi:hypothetical protein
MYRTVLADRRARLASLPLDRQARDLGLTMLAILGGRDRLYPSTPAAARYHAAGARVVVIDDAGHSVDVQRPAEVPVAQDLALDAGVLAVEGRQSQRHRGSWPQSAVIGSRHRNHHTEGSESSSARLIARSPDGLRVHLALNNFGTRPARVRLGLIGTPCAIASTATANPDTTRVFAPGRCGG